MSGEFPEPQADLSPEERRELLQGVRRLAEDVLAGRASSSLPTSAGRVVCSGAFVTLRHGGHLRGCMGHFSALAPLHAILPDVVRSALQDPRFVGDPVTLAEFPQIHIELSLLGPRFDAVEPERLVPGVHGVIISRGGRSGCFLPQVAAERGWTIEQFLGECCRQKAGLDADAWRDPGTRVEGFRVVVLEEESGSGHN